MKATETQLVYSCLEYLAAKKIFAWRANSGGMKVESGFALVVRSIDELMAAVFTRPR